MKMKKSSPQLAISLLGNSSADIHSPKKEEAMVDDAMKSSRREKLSC
jgi:hypothetical protein